jgi:prepilin-type processing-associated H-X9-DG protein
MDHEFRANLAMFDGVREDGHPPSKVSAIDIIKHVKI